MKRARSLMAVSAAVALMAVVSACSQSEQKTEAPATTTEETAAPAAATPAAPAATTPAATTPAAAPAPAAAGGILLDVKDASGTQLTGDVTRGARVFRQCMTCHVTTAGVNKVGPSLHGIIGRHSGQVPGFRYSEANKNSGIVWTEQELYKYLENPRATVPGTLMSFVGLRDSQQRADVIAYLKENTK